MRKEAPRKSGATRFFELDAMRVLAAFAVVCLHVNPLGRLGEEASLSCRLAANAMGCLFSFGVPLFFMISGALLLDPARPFSVRDLFSRRLSRLLTSFLFWSALYALAHCLLYGKGKWTFLNQLIRGHYHMWFVFAIVALYLALPLLRPVAADRQATDYLLCAGFFLSFLFPRALMLPLSFPVPHRDVLESLQSTLFQLNPYRGLFSVYYFFLGWRLRRDPPEGKMAALLCLSGILGLALALVLSGREIAAAGVSAGGYTENNSLCVLAMTAAVFSFFQSCFRDAAPREEIARRISALAGASYGVYLVHPFLLERFLPAFPQQPVLLALCIPFWGLVFFSVSAAVSLLLMRLPGIGRRIV